MKTITIKMMKKQIVLAIVVLTMFGCESYLDQREASDAIDETEVFGSYYNMRRYLEDGYTKLFHCDATEMMGTGKNHTHLSHFSDEASTNRDRIAPFKSGNWANFFDEKYDKLGNASGPGWVEFTAPYIMGWQGIRIANRTIKEIDSPTDITAEQKDELLGQAYFIRAMSYFQILERWGGMPYFKEPLDFNEYLGKKRLSYQETAANIVEDCDLAFDHLPLEWGADNTGRPVKTVALALKSRVLLYAASKTNNPSNDQLKWQAAADAGDALIKFIENEDSYHELKQVTEAINVKVGSIDDEDYTAAEPVSLQEYRNIFLYTNKSPEVLFSVNRERVRASGGGNSNGWKRYTTNLAYYVGKYYLGSQTYVTGMVPNQNFVDLFETKNGLAPDDDLTSNVPKTYPTYNPQNPYVNRDPRFYNSIIYNGVNWPRGSNDHIVELYNVGADTLVGTERTTETFAYPHTGYMMRKYWAKGAWTSSKDNAPQYVENNIAYFRVAEAYLNYAEAAFEASGRGDIRAKSSGDATYTALEALNKVRNRVGMPNLHSDYQNTTDFMGRIRNERAVEFCYEAGHRWFDMLRWHELQNMTKVQGVKMEWNSDLATYPTGYKFTTFNPENLEKTFTDRNYLYPINPEEVNQYPEFLQNPNW